MSRENILEMEEFNQNHLIPERDSVGSNFKPRPKPRPRTILTAGRNERINNINKDGIENDGFSIDDYTISSSGDHDHDFKSSTNATVHYSQETYGVDSFPSRMSSSTSSINELKNGRNPFTVTAEADVHHVENNHLNNLHKSNRAATFTISSSSSEGKLDEQEQFRIENETENNRDTKLQRKNSKPKPKPRINNNVFQVSETKSMHSVSELDVGDKRNRRSSTASDSEGESETFNKKAQSASKEDFLVVTIPPNENMEKELNEKHQEGVSSASEQQPQPSSSTSFLGKWKKAIKTFSKENVSSSKSSVRKQKSRGGKQANNDDIIEAGPTHEEELGNQVENKTPNRSIHRPTIEKTRNDSSSNQNTPERSAPGSASSKRDLHRRVKDGEINKLLGITIHYSDLLPVDPLVIHPVVKVTLMNQDGTYIPKKKQNQSVPTTSSEITNEEASNTNNEGEFNSSDEESVDNENNKRNKSKNKKQKHRRNQKLLKKRKSSCSKLTNDVILPMLTQPFQVQDYITPSFAPTWNELIVFEESYKKFIHEHSTCIFFFEIMDFLPMNYEESQLNKNNYAGETLQASRSEEGWYKIAWGFLKPVGANGVRNVNRKLRLQLYKPERLTKKEARHGPEIFCWWKLEKRTKLPSSTLYVTVKGITPPSCPTTNLRTLITMRKEDLTEALIDSQLQNDEFSRNKNTNLNDTHSSTKPIAQPVVKEPNWARLKGQSCKPPNKLLKSLPSSDFDSLKISISGSVHSVKFSPDGLLLAAGLDTEQLHTILIFEIPSGVLLKSLRGHHGLIYYLDWTNNIKLPNEVQGINNNYLAAASADFTASVWCFNYDNSADLVKKLLHPSFVYCVVFHPVNSHLVATSCFDHIIRIWNIFHTSTSRVSDAPPDHHESTPIIMLDKHSSFVNCLEFHLSGKYLFSGDGEGSIYKWKTSSKKNWKLDRNIKLYENSKSPINSIKVDPINGTKLLVHSRESCLKIVDVETFLILHTFHGFTNDKFNIRSCFSPCGNLVLSGSEDGTLCVWDTDTTKILQFIKPELQSNNCIVTSVDYHPFDYYVAIGILSSISNSEPCPILLYTYASPPKLNVSTLVKMKKLAKTYQQHRNEEQGQLQNDAGGGDMQLVRNDNLKNEIINSPKLRSPTPANPKAGVNGPQESLDSTDKFMSILRKLDSALKVTSNVIHKPIDDISENNAERLKELPPISGKPPIPPKPRNRKLSQTPLAHIDTETTTPKKLRHKSKTDTNENESEKYQRKLKHSSKTPKTSRNSPGRKNSHSDIEDSTALPKSPTFSAKQYKETEYFHQKDFRDNQRSENNEGKSPKKKRHSSQSIYASQDRPSRVATPPATDQFHHSVNEVTTGSTNSKRLQRRHQNMHLID